MAGVKWIFLLINFQGFYLGSVCQEWTFPSRITALIGSCVEIPCRYRPARNSRTSSTVWYLNKFIQRDPEILNTGDSSSVMAEYRNRTSLVPENSCTLRIDPVRRGDGGEYYYPGISEDKITNAYEKQSRKVLLNVTDIPGKCDLHVPPILTEGEDTIILCTAEHTCRSRPPSLQWNKPGWIQNKTVDFSGGTWGEESMLTYVPSYLDDGTPVQCTATYPNGQKTERLEILNINYAPKNVTVTITGSSLEGGDVTLQCNSFSKPDVDEYKWYKGKKKLQNTGRKIKVRNVTWNMAPFSCAAINHLGRGESAPTEIPVQYAPKNVTVTITGNSKLMEGSDVTLQCNSFSNPDVDEYKWYKGKNKLQNTGQNIKVRNVTWNMAPFSCAAINHLGKGESDQTEIPVQYAPRNVTVTITGNSELIERSDVMLQCNSFSNPDVDEYEWYQGKTKLPDRGREIIVRNVTRDMGPYSCAARNHVGRGESAPTEIPVQYENSGSRNIILLATIGTICSLLLVLLVYFCWRKRSQMSQTTHEFGNAAHITIAGGHEGAASQYENIHHQIQSSSN